MMVEATRRPFETEEEQPHQLMKGVVEIDEDAGSWSGTSSVSEESVVTRKGERMKWWKVYAMHFLFAWNSRTYENVSVRLRTHFIDFNVPRW